MHIILACIAVSELCAKSLASYTADDKPFLRIAQQFLRPVNGTAIHKFYILCGRSSGMNVKTDIEIISSALRTLFIKYALYVFELRPERCQKLRLDKLCIHI